MLITRVVLSLARQFVIPVYLCFFVWFGAEWLLGRTSPDLVTNLLVLFGGPLVGASLISTLIGVFYTWTMISRLTKKGMSLEAYLALDQEEQKRVMDRM